ncbi:MAG: FAD-binding oxidoreductase [Desulfobacterales bacterium]|nr:FAD-binding oxidoreductase [Desulfobacterales bacterium]MDX2512830.1 FAD-binding oxidoreductase [Desulfobacterales bacterium]
MKKGIWEDFDGYEGISEEIKASRITAGKRSFELDFADQYIRRLHPDRLALKVADIIQETLTTKTFRLVSSENNLPPFQAGQYLSLFIEVEGILTSRPYSISSQPNQIGYYDITVKQVPGGLVSNFLLNHISIGDSLTVSGPQGNFYFNPLVHDENMICIAGGSGITPFMSMIREIVDRGLPRTLTLFYGNRQAEDIIFHEQLTHISGHFDRIRYIPVIEKTSKDYQGQCGLITADLIKEVAGASEKATFFLCGPQGMYDFCLPQIEQLGVPPRKIRKELYGPPLDISKDPGWPKEIEQDHLFSVSVKGGRTINAPATTPLLVSLEKSGVVPPSICRSGECSMCRIKILSGKVFQPAGTPVRKTDHQYGYVHSCVSYPLEDLEILL